MIYYMDTHVVAWLYEGKLGSFSKQLLDLIGKNKILLSPMVVLELTYLHEIGRVQGASQQVIDSLNQSIGLTICDLPFSQVIQSAMVQTWTRDPFDRIIVGQAAVNQSPLITKDVLIRTHYVHVVWDSES